MGIIRFPVLFIFTLNLATSIAQVPAEAPAPDDLADEEVYETGPGLDGTTGVNVTLLTYNTTCEGLGPETRISGDGTFSGEGLFVGEGTFSTSEDSGPAQIIVTNGTFLGEGVCAGVGTFSTVDPDATLTVTGGTGTIDGTGFFHIPQGLFNGTGSFSGGDDLSFSNGSATLFGQGVLAGTGNASGAIACTGTGSLEGQGALTGTGTFVGSGYYYATLPTESAEFIGTGVVDGIGNCDTGDVLGLQPGADIAPDIAEILDEGDAIYEAVVAVQDTSFDAAPQLAPQASAG